MLLTSLIIFLIGAGLTGYALWLFKHVKTVNEDVRVENEKLDKENIELTNTKISIQDTIKAKQEQLKDIQSNITTTIIAQENISQQAFENYCAILEHNYNEKEKEYDQYKDALETAYSNRQLELMREIDETNKELDQLKATRTAAMKAQLREKQIENQISFYCLAISDSDKNDIQVLETVAPKLNKPRTLYMLIWQTFFRTPMNNLCSRVIGTEVKSGIYKITNTKTKECYIGQAVDLASRWKDHAKYGLKIDTPAGNQLYKAMQEDGIYNFTWEVLEYVEPAQLNEKEAYYIQLYDSIAYGYNGIKAPTTKGR